MTLLFLGWDWLPHEPARRGSLALVYSLVSSRSSSTGIMIHFGPPRGLGIAPLVLLSLCAARSDYRPSRFFRCIVGACAILLRSSVHDGFVTALTRLPGSLPSFIVLLLPPSDPRLAAVLPTVPDAAVSTMTSWRW